MPEATSKATSQDEGAAISGVSKALTPITDQAARDRILAWALSAFGSGKVTTPHQGSAGAGASGKKETPAPANDLGEFMEQADPQNQTDRVLVIGSWLQKTSPDGFGSQLVNNELKEMGHPIKNITRKLDALIDRKPAYVRQVGKSGRSKQARKKYKLTDAGQKRVTALLRGEGKSEASAAEEED